jgi:hypothetical protein
VQNEQVGNLLSLVSKLRTLAKKNLNEQKQVFGLLVWRETVDVQEFKFVYSKAIEKCP